MDLKKSPNPGWQIGEKVRSPVEAMVTLDFAKLEPTARYKVIVGGIVPRPIALVSTVSTSGRPNLAPFSFFNGVSSEPPCLCFSVTFKKGGVEKDTLRNIRETKEFVVNSVSEWMAEPMHQSSAEYPSDVDEMAAVGLTPLSAVRVKPARVKESPLQWECRLEQLVQIGGRELGAATLIIGRILLVHVYESAFEGGKILIEKLKPIARVGGRNYAKVNDLFEMWDPDARIQTKAALGLNVSAPSGE